MHACMQPRGSSREDTQDKQVQVEVDRLAAAPRKTLNRNPAGKIACSQSSQGDRPAWPIVRAPVHGRTGDIDKSEPQEVGDRLRLLSTDDWS